MSVVPALIAAMLLTLFSKAPLAVAQARTKEGYDNTNPREQQARLEGWGQRARAAHQNGWEAFSILGVGAAVALATGHDGAVAAGLAWAWVGLRLLYIAIYIRGMGNLRTVVFSAALLCSIGLYALPLIGR